MTYSPSMRRNGVPADGRTGEPDTRCNSATISIVKSIKYSFSLNKAFKMAKLSNQARSESTLSLSSTASQAERYLTEATILELIDFGSKIIKDLHKRAGKTNNTALQEKFDVVLEVFSELTKRVSTTNSEMDTLSTSVLELEARTNTQDQIEHDLRKHISSLTTDIRERLDNLPTHRDIALIVRKVIDEAQTETQDLLTSQEQQESTQPQHIPQQTSTPRRQRQRSPSPITDRPHKRTLIIKGATNRITSREIQQILTQYKACAANTIQK